MRKFITKAIEKIDKLDINQIHTLLNHIAEENERYESVLQSMPNGVVVCESNHKVILVNKAAERLLQINGNDSLERLVWDAVRDPDVASFVRTCLTNEESVKDKEFTFQRGSANQVVGLSITPLVKNGSITGNLIWFADITDRRQNEARLRRAESLASLTTLAAGVAHEIKNPLGSISIHIQLIQKGLKNIDSEMQETLNDHLEIINEEISRLNSIIVDFLFAVRPMDIKLECRDINEVISDVVELVEVELDGADIGCENSLAEELPCVSIDDKYIKQALLNLVKNSIAAMPDGGILTIRSFRRGEHIMVEVEDTGVGISTDNMEKIFEPYFTTKDFGSGLGLTMVYKIVKEHMGDISVRSREREGTVFSIALPIPQKELHLIDWQGTDYEV